MWLQFGYKYSEESLETTEFADKMDEKRILNAVFHKMSRSESRIRIKRVRKPETVAQDETRKHPPCMHERMFLKGTELLVGDVDTNDISPGLKN